jgi:hypothetical protein
MNYRIVRTPEDIAQANGCIASTGYYDEVDLSTVGGLALAAFDENDDCCGVVWVAISGKLAILDYLAIRNGYSGLGVRLLVRLRAALTKIGIQKVRYTVHGRNVEAMRISEVLGGLNDFPYLVGCVNLEAENGK